MRFFLISDNSDAMNGLRLAGIEGTVARSEADLRQALENAAKQPDIAVLLVTEKIAETYTEVLDSDITSEITKEAACGVAGEETFTATVTFAQRFPWGFFASASTDWSITAAKSAVTVQCC